MADKRTPSRDFKDLVEIMTILRKECPWDRQQTHESIKDLMVEEIYEAIEAIDNDDPDELRKELGDLLLHVVFHTEIAREASKFNIGDVIYGIQEKLIRRHPHVFPDFGTSGVTGAGEEAGAETESAGAESAGAEGTETDAGISRSGTIDQETVIRNWEDLKMKEADRTSVLQGVPDSLPALIKAQRMQEKAAAVGFDWKTWQQAWPKLQEEFEEFRLAAEKGDETEQQEEFGDMLFSLVNVGRLMGLNVEDALRLTNRKFQKRFQHIEKVLNGKGKQLSETSLEEMDEIWDEAKKREFHNLDSGKK